MNLSQKDLTYKYGNEGANDADPILWEDFAENLWSTQMHLLITNFVVVNYHISDTHNGE